MLDPDERYLRQRNIIIDVTDLGLMEWRLPVFCHSLSIDAVNRISMGEQLTRSLQYGSQVPDGPS